MAYFYLVEVACLPLSGFFFTVNKFLLFPEQYTALLFLNAGQPFAL